MNDNNEKNLQNGNADDIDEILNIIKKRKHQDLENNSYSDDAPTRIDNKAVNTTQAFSSVSFEADSMKGFQSNTERESSKNAKPIQENRPVQKPVTESKKSEAAPKPAVKSSSPKTPPEDNKATSFTNGKPAASKKPSENVHHHEEPGKGISLDDFGEASPKKKEGKRKEGKFFIPGYIKLIIYLVCVFGVSITLSYYAINIGNDVFAFVKSNEEISIELPHDATLSDLADELHEKGVIKYPGIFKAYSKFRLSKRSYLTGEFLPGRHKVNPSMNFDQLLDALSVTKSRGVVRVTIPEGYTLTEIADLFVEKQVVAKDKRNDFIKAIENYDGEYDFLSDIDDRVSEFKDEDGKTLRSYRLEGYLYPDTYDFYVNESFDSIIDKFLTNFNNKFDKSFYARCEDLGYSTDEIITLASIIEAEGESAQSFAKISSVFHNRLKYNDSFTRLDADSTTLYALNISGKERKVLQDGDVNFDHPYNTRKVNGLIPGPICNPGYEAIYAALYPYEPFDANPARAEYLEDVPYDERTDIDFYYFITINGVTRFAGSSTAEFNKFNNWKAELRNS